MSVAYEGPSGDYAPSGRVNFGWISEAWQLFMAQAGIWIAATLALMALPIILLVIFYGMMWTTMFPGGFPPHPPGSAPFPSSGPNPFAGTGLGKILTLELGFGLVMSVYSAFLYGGLFRMAVRQVRGLPLAFGDIFAGGPLFGRMLGAIFLLAFGTYGVEGLCAAPALIMVGTHAPQAALIVTFLLTFVLIFCLIWVLWGLLLPAFALIADGEPIISALRRSIQAMKGNWVSAAGFVFVLFLLVYASEIPCGLGLFATMPMVFLITALAYRDMVGMQGIVTPISPYGATSTPGHTPGVWPPPPGQQPSFGQPPANPPPANPPRRSLSGDDLDDGSAPPQ